MWPFFRFSTADILILQLSIFYFSILPVCISMNTSRESVYGVGLLDDLHNYFPGLLYEPERFRTVSEVLSYIRENTSRRFNLFDHGRRQYINRYRANQQSQNTFVSTRPVVNTWTPSVDIPRSTRIDIQEEISFLLPLLSRLQTPISSGPIQRADRRVPLQGLFRDIIVSASQELIDSASSTRSLTSDLEDSCPICQDRMRVGENIRKLNACQHEFHTECVDNWYLNLSVLCPVCRHDLRDLTEVRRSPRLTAATPRQAAPNLPPINDPQESESD
jgi:hypothetical protein